MSADNALPRLTPSGMSAEEVRRLRRRRQLARKTPAQRRAMLQYTRRHNEHDERVRYCDYCDLFVSTSPKCWRAHLRSQRHMDEFEAYYALAAHVESVWLTQIRAAVAQARVQDTLRRQQAGAGGANATVALPAMRIAPHIVVGGVAASMNGATTAAATAAQYGQQQHKSLCESTAVGATTPSPPPLLPRIRVGDTVVHAGSSAAPIRVAGQLVTAPRQQQQGEKESESADGAQ